MKRISRMFYFALLLLVGTVSVQNTALCLNALTATPSTLTFNVTSSPSASQSYTLTNVSDKEDINVTLNSTAHTQISPNGTYFMSSMSNIVIPKNNGTVTIFVRVVTDSLISTLNEVITNSGYSIPNFDLEVYAPVQINGSAPLPIQLASFEATTLVNKGVTLIWTTVSETNNYGFYVQCNGVDLTFVAGHGTTLDQHTYSYTDNPGPGQYRYGLKQVDLNGKATLSETIMLNVVGKFALGHNYPNPFNPSTCISFSITMESPVSVRVYDILGREVATLVNENRKAGQYTERFDGSRLASGVYMYVLKSAEGRLVGRMMLSK